MSKPRPKPKGPKKNLNKFTGLPRRSRKNNGYTGSMPVTFSNQAKTGGKNLAITVSHRELVEARVTENSVIHY